MKNTIVLAALLLVACREPAPDPNAKAGRTDCDRACSRIVGFLPTPGCADLCIERQWTVGDVRCVADAKTNEQAKDCAVAAKLLLDAKKERKAEDKVKALQDAQRKRVDALLDQLSQATDEPTRLKIQKQLEAERDAVK